MSQGAHLSRSYTVQEFAELAGVTVKALHLYDRLGLLRPRRSHSGYRLYCERDLERLEQIIALKFLGLPLKRIKVLLEPSAPELGDALKMQRGVLEEKQQTAARAIQAIREAERAIESGQPAGPAILKKIIEVMNMHETVDVMKRYFCEDAWAKIRPHFEHWPPPAWEQLYRDIDAARGGAAGDSAEALAIRWINLAENDAA